MFYSFYFFFFIFYFFFFFVFVLFKYTTYLPTTNYHYTTTNTTSLPMNKSCVRYDFATIAIIIMHHYKSYRSLFLLFFPCCFLHFFLFTSSSSSCYLNYTIKKIYRALCDLVSYKIYEFVCLSVSLCEFLIYSFCIIWVSTVLYCSIYIIYKNFHIYLICSCTNCVAIIWLKAIYGLYGDVCRVFLSIQLNLY